MTPQSVIENPVDKTRVPYTRALSFVEQSKELAEIIDWFGFRGTVAGKVWLLREKLTLTRIVGSRESKKEDRDS